MTNTNNTINNTINNTAANDSMVNNLTANNSLSVNNSLSANDSLSANVPETQILNTAATGTYDFNIPLDKLLTALRLIEPSQKKHSGYLHVTLNSNMISLENRLSNNDVGRTKLFCHFFGEDEKGCDEPIFTEKAGVSVKFESWEYNKLKDFLELIDGEVESVRLTFEIEIKGDITAITGIFSTGARAFKLSCIESDKEEKREVYSRSDYSVASGKTDILAALRNAKKAKGPDNERMREINGISFEPDLNDLSLKLVTLDGFRISINKLKLDYGVNKANDAAMLSYSGCDGLIKQMTKATVTRPEIVIVNYDDATEDANDTESLTFAFNGVVNGNSYVAGVSCERERLPFFNYEPFTKEKPLRATFKVDKAELKRKLKALKPFVKDNLVILQHDYTNDGADALRINGNSNAVKIPAEATYNKCFAFGVNYKFLTDAINSQTGKTVKIDIIHHFEPAVISDEKGLNLSYLLPVRLTNERYSRLNED